MKSPVLERRPADFPAVIPVMSPGWEYKAVECFEEGCLSTAIRTQKNNLLPGLYLKGKIVQDRGIFLVRMAKRFYSNHRETLSISSLVKSLKSVSTFFEGRRDTWLSRACTGPGVIAVELSGFSTPNETPRSVSCR